MEEKKDLLEKWLEFREEELESGLSKEDKKHIYDFEKCADMVLNCVDGNMYNFAKKELDKLENDVIELDNIKIEVVHAIHGYQPLLKGAKEVGAVLTIPIHMDNPAFTPDYNFIKEMFEKYEVEYEILENDETIEIE